LLVVIGVIAVLIAILLPALQSARRQANTVKCLSSLRQIGMAMQFYQRDNRNTVPVMRQDYPDMGTSPMPKAKSNEYWTDRLMKYVSKTGKMNFNITKQQEFDEARKSAFWGCPAWDGWVGSGSTFTWGGISRYETGYVMNLYPTAEPSYPADPSKMPPGSEWSMRWSKTYEGKHFRVNQWTHPADRMLVADGDFWLFQFRPVANEGDALGPAPASRTGNYPLLYAGTTNMSSYRHGRTPPLQDANSFQRDGGKVAFNVLFVDGHAATLLDRREGYKAVRMRYP
jgi:prepilin-type processing-associated H-X9-DG protein